MSWANLDDVVGQLESFGLKVSAGSLVADGKHHRVADEDDKSGQRTGWYVLHELSTTAGELLLVGAYGTWREHSGGKPVSHKIELKRRELTADEKAAIRKRITVDRQRAAARRKAEAARAAKKAAAAWAKFPERGSSPYLDRKQVQAHGARFSDKGNLVLPMCDVYGNVHGLQVIYARKSDWAHGGGKRYWPKGLDKRGKFHLIGAPSWVILLVEGYATGASLHEATGLPVAVAFDAGNLLPVAMALRARYRDCRILVCGDDDFLITCRQCKEVYPVEDGKCPACDEPAHHGNAGISAASATALASGGEWMVPQFSNRGMEKLTDFNDLHMVQGLHAVRAQVEDRIAELRWRQKPAPDDELGGEGAERPPIFSLDLLLTHFALIYGTDTVFDGISRRIIQLGPLRSAAGRGLVREWLEHPDRRLVQPDQVVFDPTVGDDTADLCNLYAGWPTAPRAGSCEKLLELLDFLCSAEENRSEVFDWLLCWLAYPIQNPGAKMQTAVLMHGPEGTGKNRFFSAVRQIYGRYGGMFSQTELESQYNGWASGKLFMIGNEVVTRVELYQQQGRLKNMITEAEWQVNEKYMPARLESNHCNFVFFSNRLDIAKLDQDDRRYCVIWTPRPAEERLYVEVSAEINDGGIEALHDYLLNVSLDDFNPHSKPPTTRSKRELIELSIDSTERFWREWSAGSLPIPIQPCTSQQLFRAYVHWTREQQIRHPAPMHVFSGAVGKKLSGRKKNAEYLYGQAPKQGMCIFPDGVECPPGASQKSWLTECIRQFADAYRTWAEEGRL